MKGSTYRRCGCRDENGKYLGARCPKLKSRGHGTWSWQQEIPTRDGSRYPLRRGGYASQKKAEADLNAVQALMSIPAEDDADGRLRMADLLRTVVSQKTPLPDHDETLRRFRGGQVLATDLTVGEYLDSWLSARKISKGGKARYETDIRCHLKPHLGHIKLTRLRISDISEMFAKIDEQNEEIAAANAARREVEQRRKSEVAAGVSRARMRQNYAELKAMPPFRRVTGAATQSRIRATLRAALSAAITQQLITFNPAQHVELDTPPSSKALVWTAERVRLWAETGDKPGPVMVWTPAQTGQFLDFIEDHPLYDLFHLIAFRGLRRGEACGVRVIDFDPDAKVLTIAKQLVYDNWKSVEEGDPKTESSSADLPLDGETAGLLKARLKWRQVKRVELGDAWTDSGRLFTWDDGSWIHPGWLSEEFERLVRRSGLPPIRLHDLRHGAATLMLAAGTDIKVVQETLRHSSRAITSDLYMSVLPELAYAAAEASVKLVPRAKSTARERTLAG